MQTNKTIQLTILDRKYKEFADKILCIKVPVGTSSLSVFPDHADLISSVSYGQVVITKLGGSTMKFVVNSGYLYVRNNQIHLLVG